MRKTREILRLKYEAGLSECQIAKAANVARSTVQERLRRAREAGLAWPLPFEWDEARLEQALFPVPAMVHVAKNWEKSAVEIKMKKLRSP